MTAILVMGILALTCLIATLVLGAVVISRIIRTSFESMTHAQKLQRDTFMEAMSLFDDHLSSILDRFQAIRWEDLVSMRATEEVEEVGGFFEPQPSSFEDDEDEGVSEQRRWGPLSRLNERIRMTTEEQQLLAEDFPDETSESA